MVLRLNVMLDTIWASVFPATKIGPTSGKITRPCLSTWKSLFRVSSPGSIIEMTSPTLT